jgi:hypothetical protein
VTQDPQERPLSEIPQVYDTTFKKWITQETSEILPVLLPGAIYAATLNVEVVIPTKRVDKVFKILYDGQEQILHIEFETGYDNQLKSRLLVYNACFYQDYHLPVITMVIYPFRVTTAVSPLHIPKILTFHFQTLPLFEQDAEDIVRQHLSCMYPLVPTMQNVHVDLVGQVMRELEEIYRNDRAQLSDRFVWLRLFLERTSTVPPVEKRKIEKRLNMYDQLWDESPMIQKMREQYIIKGLEEGIQALQRSLVNVVRARFPDLAELAQQQARHFDKTSTLELLIKQVVTAPDASTVRKLLEAEADM